MNGFIRDMKNVVTSVGTTIISEKFTDSHIMILFQF